KIKQPVFLLVPQNSNVCPKKACKLLTRNHPNSKFEILSTKSHFFPMEEPLLTARKTLGFIQFVDP
ncbi:MAG: alpha/beta hydrolase, partial [Candidatus Nanoarchaeia archaeon]